MAFFVKFDRTSVPWLIRSTATSTEPWVSWRSEARSSWFQSGNSSLSWVSWGAWFFDWLEAVSSCSWDMVGTYESEAAVDELMKEFPDFM